MDARRDRVEHSIIAQECLAGLKHTLRNHCAAIRNANFYLKRKTQGSETWESDKRVPSFFELIERQLESIVELTSQPNLFGPLHERRIEPLELGGVLVEVLRTEQHRVPVEMEVGEAVVMADGAEVALALSQTLSFLEAQGASSIAVRRERDEHVESVRFSSVGATAPELAEMPAARRYPSSLMVARRVVLLGQGRFDWAVRPDGIDISLGFPHGPGAVE
jgi:hypothetical protein